MIMVFSCVTLNTLCLSLHIQKMRRNGISLVDLQQGLNEFMYVKDT